MRCPVTSPMLPYETLWMHLILAPVQFNPQPLPTLVPRAP